MNVCHLLQMCVITFIEVRRVRVKTFYLYKMQCFAVFICSACSGGVDGERSPVSLPTPEVGVFCEEGNIMHCQCLLDANMIAT